MKLLPLLLLALLTLPTASLPVAAQDTSRPRSPAEAMERLRGWPDFRGVPPPGPTDVLIVNEQGREMHALANGTATGAWRLGDDATQPTRDEAASGGTLVVFRDDIGVDRGFGGFGPWTVYGDQVWANTSAAARSGLEGIDLVGPGGAYPSLRSTMLLSPEIDLNTGMPERAPRQVYNDVNATGKANDVVDRVWRSLRGVGQGVADAVNGLGILPEELDQLGILDVPMTNPANRVDRDDDFQNVNAPPAVNPNLPSGAYVYRLSFDMRYNVQRGVDGFQVWAFTARPDAMPAACNAASQCQIPQIDLAPNGPAAAFGSGNTYTGSAPWTRVSVDIVPYVQGSLWLAFVFRSGACPVGCLEDPGAFSQTAGFRGVQLDAFQAQVEASAHSVRLRPLAKPDLVPEGRTNVTIPPGLPVPVVAEVANLGHSDEAFGLTVRLRDTAGNLVQEIGPQPVNLTAGHTRAITFPFAGLEEGQYRLNATISEVEEDAATRDNFAEMRFDVERIETVRLVTVTASSLQVQAGDPLAYAAVVANPGNVDVDVTVVPLLEEVTDNVTRGLPKADASGLLDDHAPVAFTLRAGEVRPLRWNVTTTTAGQFQLNVTLQAPQIAGPATLLGPAVGIDRTPPPMLYHGEAGQRPRGNLLDEDKDGPKVPDWTRAGAVTGDQAWHDGTDYWLDPGAVHYLGRKASSACQGNFTHFEGCQPYATQAVTVGGQPQPAILLTPIVFVDAAAPAPSLVFEHQFATSAFMKSCLPAVQNCNGVSQMDVFGGAFLEGRTGVLDNLGQPVWDSRPGSAEGWIQLNSEVTPVMRGAVGEQVLGVYDPATGPRRMAGNCNPATSAPCHWWWPSSRTLEFRGPGEEYASLHEFDGSPWILERVPLAGVDHGDLVKDDFDARGKIFQARFRYPLVGVNLGDGTVASVQTLGWRLGALAVVPTPAFQSDLAIVSLEPRTPYDPSAIGLGPGTNVSFQVEVTNRGALDATEVLVELRALNGTLKDVASATVTLPELKAGRTANVTVPWAVPDAEGLRLRLRAEVRAASLADDFPGDNVAWSKEAYRVEAHRDLAAVADVLPRSGSVDTLRILALSVENRGNVPLKGTGAEVPVVTSSLERLTGVGQPRSLGTQTWHVLRAIQPGERLDLSDPTLPVTEPDGTVPDLSSELLFQPRVSGSYRQLVKVSLPGGPDANGVNDVVAVPFKVSAALYSDRFDKPVQRDPLVILGVPTLNGTDVWTTDATGAKGSPLRLLAGDPERNEMPAGTDSSYVLPPLDLTPVKRATLTFAHRFDLESGFDGSRVEISLDGGKTWDPLQPRADPAHKLPLGYSSAPLLSDLVLADGRVAPTGAVYTGDSRALPPTGLGEGWQAAEFDLGDHPGLRRDVTLEAFPLSGLAPRATGVQSGLARVRVGEADPVGQAPRQFTDPSWAMPEEGAVAAERYWWIDNQTYMRPQPRTAAMLWSGSQGTDDDRLDVFLNYTLPAGGDLTWWEWRDGWRDGDRFDTAVTSPRMGQMKTRDGTGGQFRVEVKSPDQPLALVAPEQVEAEPDGWTLRRVELAGPASVSFHYIGDERRKGNRGWFLDDVRLDGAPVAPSPGPPHRDWTCIGTGSALGEPCVAPQAAAWRPGGWHVEDGRLQPDGTLGQTWRFSDPDTFEGYPSGASARLVTPVVDLGRVAGDDAWLSFEHRYDFQAIPMTCCGNPPLDGRDGGTVEVQALNETTGAFEPWRVLIAAEPTGFSGVSLRPELNQGDGWRMRSPTGGDTGHHFRAMGYPAMQAPLQGSDLPRLEHELVRSEVRQGYPWPLPHTPVFSGEQSDWTAARFDLSSLIGRKVRFAFHAVTDSTVQGNDQREGWEIGNVAVFGTAFEGKEALLRLRVATDESRIKGEWSVDDLQLSGDLYRLHMAVVPDHPELRVPPGSEVDVRGNITNIGVEKRDGIALRVSVQDEAGDPIDFRLVSPVLHPVREGLPDGVTGVVGNLTLVGGEKRPFLIQFTAPPSGRARVDIRLYEDRGPTEFRPGLPPVHTPKYLDPLDEVPGSGMATVTVRAETVRDVRFEPPSPGGTVDLAVTPFTGNVSQPVTFRAGVRNEGTATETVPVRFTVVNRLQDRNRLFDKTIDVVLAPGASGVAATQWTPTVAGMYRVEASVTGIPSDGPVRADVPVGQGLQVFTARFDEPRWAEGNNSGDGVMGMNNDWDLLGGSALWGVPESLYTNTFHYCNDGTPLCDPGGGGGMGIDSWIATVGAPIDVRVPAGDEARLLLTHVWAFANGDGAVVEVAPFGDRDGQLPVCPANTWFRITPEGGYPGRTVTDLNRQNPLGGGPAFTGRSEGSTPVTSVFDLARQDLTSQAGGLTGDCAAAAAPGGLLGNHLALRLRVGTRAHDDGDRGWLVLAASVGSSALRLGPRGAPDIQGFERVLPVLDGMPKRFLALVGNDGPVGDRATLELAPDGAVPAGWITLPDGPAVLEPGQERAVPFRVAIPAEAQAARTVYPAPLLVRSGNAPTVTDRLLTGFNLQENLLPDLNVRVRLDGGAPGGGVETGSPATVTAIVSNLGRLPSQPVRLLFFATPVGGATQPLGEAEIPALAPATGGRGSFVAIGKEWISPDRPGLVDLLVQADPAGLVVEQRRDNNNATLRVDVVGSDAPDLAITDLRATGLSPDGFAEAGSFITINATVANLGRTAAPDVRVQVLLGSGVVAEEVIRQLLPGQEVTLSTLKAAPAGDFVLRAFALSSAAKPDPNPDNDQATRMLRVRGHKLAVELAGAPPVVAPGGRADLALRLENLANAPDRLRLEFADGNLTRQGWSFEAFPNPVIALPGTQTRVFVLLNAPPGATAGPHTLALRAVPLSAPALALPFDVTVHVAQTSSEIRLEGARGSVVGRDATVDVTVRNVGNTVRTVQVAVLGDERAVEVSLAPFEAREVRLSHRLFAAPQEGAVTLPLSVFDATGTLAGLKLELEVDEIPIIEARWSSVTSAPDGAGRSRLRLVLDLANAGNEAVRVRPTVWGVEATVEPATIDLPVGGTGQAVLLVGVPDPLPERLSGAVRLVRDDNPSLSVAEVELPALPPQPNLRLEGWQVDAGESPRAGAKVPFSFELRNTGGAASEPTLALVYVDRTLKAALPVPALQPGEAVGLSGSVKLPEGRHALIVLANTQRGVAELRSDDNGASSVLQVAAPSWLQRATPGPDPGLLALALAAAAALAAAGRRRR
jgi:hypothetical protein